MRRPISWPLVAALAIVVHADWHFARPHHYRLSLEWSSHWLFALVSFAIAGWYIAGKWPDHPWRASIWNVVLALVIAQGIEPVLEAVIDGRGIGYLVAPERWTAFWQCVGAGVPALALAVWIRHRGNMSKKSTNHRR
jgi:hypothetical protein